VIIEKPISKILMKLHVLSHPEHEKVVFGMLLSVWRISAMDGPMPFVFSIYVCKGWARIHPALTL
jgi:hypothetical protein